MLTLSGNAILPGWQSCSRRSPTLFERKHWRGVPATPCMSDSDCRLHSGLGTPCHILKGQAAEISCGPSFTDSRTSSRVLCRRPPMAPISSDRSLAWHSARALARRLGLCSTPAGHSGLRLLIEWMLRKSDLKLLQIWIPKEVIGSSDLQAVEDLHGQRTCRLLWPTGRWWQGHAAPWWQRSEDLGCGPKAGVHWGDTKTRFSVSRTESPRHFCPSASTTADVVRQALRGTAHMSACFQDYEHHSTSPG